MKKNVSFLCVFLLCVMSIRCDKDEEDENCPAPTSVTVNGVWFTGVIIDIEASNVQEYVVHYGLQGIDPSSTELSVAFFETPQVVIDQLIPGVTYDFYVSVICNNEAQSDSIALLNITTASEIVIACFPPINVTSFVIDYNEALVSWEASLNNELSYELEYGFTGFELGTGIQKPAVETQLLLDALVVGTSYDIYIRSYCDEEDVSTFDGPFIFTTRACVLPSGFMISEISTTTVLASWEGNGEVSWELEYGTIGFELGEGEVVFLGETEVVIENLSTMTTYEVYLRANCGPNGRSKYIDPFTFTTL